MLSDSIHSVMSSSSSSHSDRKNIKTNGSLIQSPTSPRSAGGGNSVFNYNNNKILSTTNPTYIHHTTKSSMDAYKDDERLYDCPADLDIKPQISEATPGKPKVLNTSMTASVYADDERIYDRPADIILMPPPVPAHSSSSVRKSASSELSEASGHRKTDSSSSSELTVVSSAASFRTAVPEILATSHSETSKVRQYSNLYCTGTVHQTHWHYYLLCSV